MVPLSPRTRGLSHHDPWGRPNSSTGGGTGGHRGVQAGKGSARVLCVRACAVRVQRVWACGARAVVLGQGGEASRQRKPARRQRRCHVSTHTRHKARTHTRTHARTHAPGVADGDVRVRVARVAPPLLPRLRRKALRRVGHQVVDAVAQKRDGHVGPEVGGKLRARRRGWGGAGVVRTQKGGLRLACVDALQRVCWCVWRSGRVPRRRSRGGGPWAA